MVGHVVAEAHDSRLVATGSTLSAQVFFARARAQLRASHIPEPTTNVGTYSTTFGTDYVMALLVLTWLPALHVRANPAHDYNAAVALAAKKRSGRVANAVRIAPSLVCGQAILVTTALVYLHQRATRHALLVLTVALTSGWPVASSEQAHHAQACCARRRWRKRPPHFVARRVGRREGRVDPGHPPVADGTLQSEERG